MLGSKDDNALRLGKFRLSNVADVIFPKECAGSLCSNWEQLRTPIICVAIEDTHYL